KKALQIVAGMEEAENLNVDEVVKTYSRSLESFFHSQLQAVFTQVNKAAFNVNEARRSQADQDLIVRTDDVFDYSTTVYELDNVNLGFLKDNPEVNYNKETGKISSNNLNAFLDTLRLKHLNSPSTHPKIHLEGSRRDKDTFAKHSQL